MVNQTEINTGCDISLSREREEWNKWTVFWLFGELNEELDFCLNQQNVDRTEHTLPPGSHWGGGNEREVGGVLLFHGPKGQQRDTRKIKR